MFTSPTSITDTAPKRNDKLKPLVSTEDAEKEAETLAEKYQMTKQEFLDAFGGLDMIKYDLSMRKAIDVLKGE